MRTTNQQQFRATAKRVRALHVAIAKAPNIATLRQLTAVLHDEELELLRIEQRVLYEKLQQRAIRVAMTIQSPNVH